MSQRTHNGRTDLRKAASKRLSDARALLASPGLHARGAAYLAGYAIECKLKAIAMEIYGCWDLDELAARWRLPRQEVYSHGLEAFLSRLPGMYKRLRRSRLWRSAFASQVNQWRVDWRYDPRDWSNEKAEAFFVAVEEVYNWLDSNWC